MTQRVRAADTEVFLPQETWRGVFSLTLTKAPIASGVFFVCVFCLFRAVPAHMEVPRLGVESEL